MPKRGWQLAQANTVEYLQRVPALELLDLLPTAVLGVGLLGEIVYASPAFAEMLGYSDARVVTRLPLPELLAGHGGVPPSDCLSTLRAVDSAVEWNHRQGYVIHTLVSPPLLLRENDTVLLVEVTDVSDLLWDTNRRPDTRIRQIAR
jgi:PAS domain-containing protein